MAPPALFAGRKFLVVTGSDADLARKAELVALLKAHGGEVLTRTEALRLQPADVMRLVIDAFAVPDKDTGIVRASAREARRRGLRRWRVSPLRQAFFDSQWAFSSASKGVVLDTEVYRLKPLGAPAAAGGAKRKYLRCAPALSGPCCAV